MRFQFPREWQYDSTESFVVGDGPYAKTLAFVFSTVCVSAEKLSDQAGFYEGDSYPLVLENLKRVLFTIPPGMPTADAIRCHRRVWKWVEKLSPFGDQHDLVFVFVLPPDAAAGYEGDLALGLGIQDVDPKTVGIAFWRSSGSLRELLDVLEQVRPMDLPPLRARQTADARHVVLAHLRKAVQGSDLGALQRLAQEVLTVFSEHEYHLDLFCNPPSHQNGNQLRQWLHRIVTESVTPEVWETGRKYIDDWLAQDYKEHN
jgi:hypothetical protein